MKKLEVATLKPNVAPNREPDVDLDDLPTLDERVEKILGIVKRVKKDDGCMLFFVMYDIENDKVRRLVVKYLQKKGCSRVQKSIFLANLPMETYDKIRADLTEVQATYDNHDSIIILPISTDYINMMKLIGKNVDFDIITRSKNTLFF